MTQGSGFDFFGFGDKLAGEGEVREKFWRTAKKAARQIPFMDEVVAAYFILPFDFIPDFVVGLGYTDDLAVLTAAIAAVSAHITPAHRQAARDALADRN